MFVDMKTTEAPHVGITVPAAAARAGVDQLTIRDAVHRGDLPHRVTVTIDPADVDAWAETRTREVTV